MAPITIDLNLLLILCACFTLGFLLGGVSFYSSGRRRGFEEATEQKNREAAAQAFASYIQNIARGGSHGQSNVSQ